MPPVPKVDQGQVTAAIAAGRSAAHDDDTMAAEETMRLARLGGPDAVTFLRHVVRTERSATVAQRVRAACAGRDFVGCDLAYDTNQPHLHGEMNEYLSGHPRSVRGARQLWP